MLTKNDYSHVTPDIVKNLYQGDNIELALNIALENQLYPNNFEMITHFAVDMDDLIYLQIIMKEYAKNILIM